MQRILVLGAGFAGLWSAVAAARRLDELDADLRQAEILIVNRTPWHSIRPSNYEADLEETLVPLSDVLDPVGVKHIVADVTGIDVRERNVTCIVDGALQALAYDRLIFALGSRLALPAIPGLAAYAFSVDTYESAQKLNEHIRLLPSRPVSPGQFTALVIGAGLTGVEVATEMLGKLRMAIAKAQATRLAARHPRRP